MALTGLGYEVFLITSGTYKERHDWVNKHGIELYLACHLNAGGGSYSLVEHYYDAGPRTRKLAKMMSRSFCSHLGTAKGRVFEIERGERGSVCLSGTRPSALLLEPLFLDDPAHEQIILNDGKRIADALVAAIEEYNRGV
jgi:N-acetylmuramoyl-L-alanine amidase